MTAEALPVRPRRSAEPGDHTGLPPGEPLVGKLDRDRSRAGMWLFIASEATLFALLFFAYYYTAQGERRWLVEEPSSLKYPIPMLVVLLVSSAVLHLGERKVHAGHFGVGRVAVAVTLLLGGVFLVLSWFDYRSHMQHALPQSNAYASIFYAIVSLHLAHLLLGMLMLLFVLVVPRYEPTTRPPHEPYHAASMYWHFVDAVWVLVVALLYVAPHFRT